MCFFVLTWSHIPLALSLPVEGFNLVICYYALGDRDKMKKAFLQLLGLQDTADEDEDEEHQEEVKELTRGSESSVHGTFLGFFASWTNSLRSGIIVERPTMLMLLVCVFCHSWCCVCRCCLAGWRRSPR